MTREEADDAFDCLTRHARAVARPTGAAEALKLVDGASLAQLQRDAIIHYISVGPAVVNLAYRVLKAGTATFVAGGYAAELAGGELAGDTRDLFATRMTASGDTPAGVGAAELASSLVDWLGARLATGRSLLACADLTASAAVDGAGDLLEAAGIAYVIAQLLENPPGRASGG